MDLTNSTILIIRQPICQSNGTVHFKYVNNCMNTNIYFYLETSGGQGSNPQLNVVNFFNARVD